MTSSALSKATQWGIATGNVLSLLCGQKLLGVCSSQPETSGVGRGLCRFLKVVKLARSLDLPKVQ